MDKQQTKKFLEGISLFKALSSTQLDALASSVREVSFNAGDLLFWENGPREEFFVILEGEVELFKTSPYGAEIKLAQFHTGDFLGEGSWMPDSTHSTSARALVPTSVLVVGKTFFQHDADATIKVFSNIMQVISQRMGQSNAQRIHTGAQYFSGNTRLEHDLLGERNVPLESYYGVQTLRAVENFTISGVNLSFYPAIVNGLAMVKEAAAEANHDLGLLPTDIRDAIVTACHEIRNGKYHNHFVVDMIQGGAGTSTNMNANEVIANRALEIMGHQRGEYQFCHPNNHVNLSQSTNDAYPTAMKLGIFILNNELTEVLDSLASAFLSKAVEFRDVIKMGRTQLQDAVPMTLGQEFQAYADMLHGESDQLNKAADGFLEQNMGATAIGTGINAEPGYAEKCTEHLRRVTGFPVRLAANLVQATQDTSDFVRYSSELKRLAVKVSKICNDLRLLASGPRAGLSEINLPPRAPGSSIMPGKVNPVIPEVVNQVAFKVIGNDTTVTMAVEGGQLELNVFEPVAVQSIVESIVMLKNGLKTLEHRCVSGITANRERCKSLVYNSIGIVTALNPVIGYEKSTIVAKEALEKNASVYDLVLEKKWLTKEQLDEILSPERMIEPRKVRL